ncbi:MAG: PQQ-binding-like beta-propeller repeat protein [Verrucomicrobia bacterium]|nr:PQQ-binding-like beta-propeller repeat protein [Verrucomicrobiota bacterium]
MSAVALAAWSANAADHWPQFRGPGGRGLAAEAVPTTWQIASGENLRWSTEIPGLAHASPIVWGPHLFLTTVDRPGPRPTIKTGVYGSGDSHKEKEPHQWRLLCVDRATGAIVWNKPAHEAVPSQERHLKATHCNSTPATDGTCLVAIFGSEGLFCFEMDGTLRWRKPLGKMDAGPWDSPMLQWSFASSPVLHDGKVIVQCDVLSEQFLAVFDARDGRELWRTARQEVANWCTPALAEVGGRTQIVVNGWKQIGGYDLATGRQVWTISGGGDIPVPAPLIVGDWAFFTSAHGTARPLRAIRLAEAKGDITPPTIGDTNAAVAWCHPKLGSYMQTPIAVGDLLWSCDWQGILTCVDRATGKIHYSERLQKAGQAFTASGVAAGKHLYFVNEGGDVFVVPIGPQFSVVAKNSLDGLGLATPAIASGTIYFRTTERLLAIGPR